jgi:probable HAF family extracellular repeat protein
VAYTIDAQGNIWGTATDSDGNLHAVEWSPVPEPATMGLAVMCALCWLAHSIPSKHIFAIGRILEKKRDILLFNKNQNVPVSSPVPPPILKVFPVNPNNGKRGSRSCHAVRQNAMRLLAHALLAILAFSICESRSHAEIRYTITDLDVAINPPQGDMFVSALNDSGHVTGAVLTSTSQEYSFLYDGARHDFLAAGADFTEASGINNSDQIVGFTQASGSVIDQAFLYDGSFHDLGIQGRPADINNKGHIVLWGPAAIYDGTVHSLSNSMVSSAINDNDQLTGYFSLTGSVHHAFFYDGVIHDLGTLGGTNSNGNAINVVGHIAGTASLPPSGPAQIQHGHAFLYDGTMHDLGTTDGLNSSVGTGINNAGQLVGYSWFDPAPSLVAIDSANDRAFVYTPQTGVVDLNTLIDPSSGWVLNDANSINNVGQILGYGTIGGQWHAFLLTPVPEPSAAILLLVACAVAMFGYRRRNAR